jgi:hypothetical protein
MAPCEIADAPILFIRDDSVWKTLTLLHSDVSNHMLFFPPASKNTHQLHPPVILRLRHNHCTLLRPKAGSSSEFLNAVLPLISADRFRHPIDALPYAACRIAHALNMRSPLEDIEELKTYHDLALLNLSQQFPRTHSQITAPVPPPPEHSPARNGALPLQDDDQDAEGHRYTEHRYGGQSGQDL